MSLPLVAIVGRANVGKSTLFNRITRMRSAIVDDMPGVTRDRIYGRAQWRERPFLVIDTGGIDIDEKTDIDAQVKDQARLAMSEADAIIFVADGRQGPMPRDREILGLIRKSPCPFFLAVNKADEPVHDAMLDEFAEFGVDAFAISAEHGRGVESLMEAVAERLPAGDEAENEDAEAVKIAIVGKPNAGKSSLVNSLLDAERCIVSEIPGTTRDAVDSFLTVKDKKYVLIDTAGIRRKGRTLKVLDKYSVIMALKAMERCDIVALVLDAETGIADQDATIAGYAYERGRACIIVLNKWDLVKDKPGARMALHDQIRQKLKFLDYAPIVVLSAKTGFKTDVLLQKADTVYKEYSRQLSTSAVNKCISRALEKNPMSSFRGKNLKLFYTTQVKNRPPTFRCFVNYPEGVHFSYQRYLANCLRKSFGFSGTPLRLLFTSRPTRSMAS